MGKDRRRSVFVFGEERRSWAVLKDLLGQRHVSVQFFTTRQDCLSKLSKRPCNLIIIDCDDRPEDRLELIAQVRRMFPQIPILVLAHPWEIRLAVQAIRMGTTECLEKPVDEGQLLATVEAALSGVQPGAPPPGQPLTEAETKVLQLILAGNTNKGVAATLNRSRRTVEAHRRNIMRKLGASNLAGLVRRALEMGLVPAKPGNETDMR